MKLSKIDLSKVVAVGHDREKLGLLIDRDQEIEYLEIPAPREAYQGLKQVSNLAFEPSMQPVKSACATAVGYDQEQQVLQIAFVSGAVYQYEGVDAETWENLQQSDSVGKFYNSQIKRKFASQAVDTVPPAQGRGKR